MFAFLGEEVREDSQVAQAGELTTSLTSLQGDPSFAWAHLPALTERPPLSDNREAAKSTVGKHSL